MTTSERHTWRILIVVGIIFLTGGVSQGALGPILPELARQAGTNIVAVGGIFTALFVAGFVAQTTTAIYGRRIGQTPLLAIGMICSLAGLSGIALAWSLPVLLSAAALNGFGMGILFMTGTLIAGDASSRAGPLNAVNAMFGVGAIIGPLLVTLSLATLGVGLPGYWGAPVALAVGFFLLVLWHPRRSASGSADTAPAAGPANLRAVLSTRLVWLLGLFCLFEVSLEIGLGAWLPTILRRAADLSPADGAKLMTLFWFLLTAGRLVATWASGFLDPLAILRIAVAFCLVGSGMMLTAVALANVPLAVAAAAVVAPALGPVMPSGLAAVRAAFPNDASVATGVVFAMTNLAGASVPLLLGALIEHVGPAAAAAAYVVSSAAMLAVLAVISRHMRSPIAVPA